MRTKVEEDLLGEATPHKSLCYYDGDRIFTVLHNGRLFYLHQADEDNECWSYFARETTAEEMEAVERNKTPLRDFLKSSSPMYLVRLNFMNLTPPRPAVEVFIVDQDDFEDDYYPREGVYLHDGGIKE